MLSAPLQMLSTHVKERGNLCGRRQGTPQYLRDQLYHESLIHLLECENNRYVGKTKRPKTQDGRTQGSIRFHFTLGTTRHTMHAMLKCKHTNRSRARARAIAGLGLGLWLKLVRAEVSNWVQIIIFSYQ